MGVRENIAGIGTDRGTFNQTAFRGATTSVDDVEIDGGYCSGVCLDWTRRVLLSGQDRDAKFLAYEGDKYAVGGQKQTQTLGRMAGAYAGHSSSYIAPDQTLPLKLKPLLNEPEETLNLNGNNVTGILIPLALAEHILLYFDMPAHINPFHVGWDPAGAVSKQTLQGWITPLESSQHLPHTRGGREWTQFAGELDEKLGPDKKKTYGKLKVVASRPQQVYESAGAWRGELLEEGFLQGCCTIVAVSPVGEDGHAVAVHQLQGGVYRFFDPNYGVIDYNKQSLRTVFQHLFGAKFFNAPEPGPDPHLPVYQRATATTPTTGPWKRMGYTIFKKI